MRHIVSGGQRNAPRVLLTIKLFRCKKKIIGYRPTMHCDLGCGLKLIGSPVSIVRLGGSPFVGFVGSCII